MQALQHLQHIIETLLSPEGCPWDREQTIQTMRPLILEEAYEVVEAIDLESRDKLCEELGDLFFNLLFIIRISANELHLSLEEVIQSVAEKLIRRHPHVFGDRTVSVSDSKEVLQVWEEVKRQEKGNHSFKSQLDSLPKGLPALMHAQKALKKMRKAGYQQPSSETSNHHTDEESWGEQLLQAIELAQASGIDAEIALKGAISKREKAFRTWEQSQTS